ncbi:hypothetical protein FHW36_11163 [Chitinophaga polysaccharea]|uniref:DUF1579 domain-containing protein n=1 Tax=Chitinophaga polysaccharea TaxID=1293035 RepID=A0A561P6Y2_9BACT|nr:hypothetical protein [Chitinophaga polysaccharea]TWF33873.1 hypothetical protein FHW36_11163 [Chitinophaga polysaccharea]
MRLLLSTAPGEDRKDAMQLYGQLAGKWQTTITYYPINGPERTAIGEWEFGYALEGRAVIDVWQIPTRATALDTGISVECGLCVRVYDPVLDLWKFTFHGPLYRTTINMLAYPIGNEIVQERLEGRDIVRWIFSDITWNDFNWRAIRSKDGGRSWRTEQVLQAKRSEN